MRNCNIKAGMILALTAGIMIVKAQSSELPTDDSVIEITVHKTTATTADPASANPVAEPTAKPVPAPVKKDEPKSIKTAKPKAIVPKAAKIAHRGGLSRFEAIPSFGNRSLSLENLNSRGSYMRATPVTLTATAYAPGEGGYYTCTGRRVQKGCIAVDPRVIPLGTWMYVDGYGVGLACDTGGAIKGHIIDLAMPKGMCNDWGRRRVKVYLLGRNYGH